MIVGCDNQCFQSTDKEHIPVPMSSGLDQMDSVDRSKTTMSLPIPLSMAMPADMTSLPPSSTNSQSAQVDMLPRLHSPSPTNLTPSSYQLAFSNQQHMHPRPSYMSFQHVASSPSTQHPMYANAALRLSESKKQPAHRQVPTKTQSSTTINQKLQQLTTTKKRPVQADPPQKARTEQLESVRSKLRESLAAALTMVSDQQSKPQASEGSPPKVASGTEMKNDANQDVVPSGNQDVVPSGNQDVVPRGGTNVQVEMENHDLQEQTSNVSLENGGPFRLENGTPINNDDLLLGHGLCWSSDIDIERSESVMNEVLKKPKLVHEEETNNDKQHSVEAEPDNSNEISQVAECLAMKIEAELFKIFDGVSKKYKEKARSLLFNLKDRNNPELRERVLSGDIVPERLCTMTAEELASKELSQWRIAKAEEHDQMRFLPDSDVDIRRLVRKTHKGEFQVEVDQDDSVSVEVAVGQSILTGVPTKDSITQSQSKTDDKTMVSEALPENENANLETLLSDDLLVDELKDTEFLPPIVSLDEFMQDLDSEPPFDKLSMNLEPEIDSKSEPESDKLGPKSEPTIDDFAPKKESLENISGSDNEGISASVSNKDSVIARQETIAKAKEESSEIISNGNESNSVSISNKESVIAREETVVKASPNNIVKDAFQLDSKLMKDRLWEGILQLNISALATVNCFFRSGERTSTEEWPAFLEIKGRVRLDAFEKFLQELHLSRSRGIMIAPFFWKQSSHESGRLNIIETINSYVADQRVGFAEPAPGVELYLCPSHPDTIKMLESRLPGNYTAALHSNIDNSLIGVVVWRKPYINTVSPRTSSHKKKHSKSRIDQRINNSCTPMVQDEEPIDDLPPGFGPGSAKVDDDLPEYKFDPSIPAPPDRPVDQMRELIEKYGKGANPEQNIVNPSNVISPIPLPLQLPPPPPPFIPQLEPPVQLYNNNMYQNTIPPLPFPSPMQLGFMQQGQLNNGLNPQAMYMQGQPNMNQMWRSPPGYGLNLQQMNNNAQMMQPCNLNMSSMNMNNMNANMNMDFRPVSFSNAPVYGMPAPVQNMGWRPDAPKNNGV